MISGWISLRAAEDVAFSSPRFCAGGLIQFRKFGFWMPFDQAFALFPNDAFCLALRALGDGRAHPGFDDGAVPSIETERLVPVGVQVGGHSRKQVVKWHAHDAVAVAAAIVPRRRVQRLMNVPHPMKKLPNRGGALFLGRAGIAQSLEILADGPNHMGRLGNFEL